MARTWQAWQIAAILVIALVPACADAAWLGYKNDTPAVIVVQSASIVNNQQVRLGKAHILYPGEIAWDAVTAPGLRQISVFDPKQPTRPLHRDVVNSQALDIFLAVQIVTPPKGQPQQPQIRFVPAKPPVMPGVNVPGAKPNQPPSTANPKTQPPGTGVPLPPNPPKPGLPPTSPPSRPGTPANPSPPGPPPSSKGK